MSTGEKQRRWTREELIQALTLYFRTPFGRMHTGNPDVKALAELIGRTPAAVSYKLVNFASFDPEQRARGIVGMGNTSKLDREIWDEFYGSWDQLSVVDEKLPRAPKAPDVTEVVREVKQRRGQPYFRSVVIAAYEGKCCITGIETEELLRASHIVPWARDEKLRLDPSNGLCLNALHDAAFDRGLITFNDGLELMLSKRLKATVPTDTFTALFERYEGEPIRKAERFTPSEQALAFHRAEVFS